MENPDFEYGVLFPFEHLHNHSSCIIETPTGTLITCWYRGSGERTADDVCVMHSRRPAGADSQSALCETWSPMQELANTDGFPDTNPFMMIDPVGCWWIFYGTQLDNQWESTLLKYRQTSSLLPGAPQPFAMHEGVLHLKPDDDAFVEAVDRLLPEAYRTAIEASAEGEAKWTAYIAAQKERARNKLSRRLGWMGRCHPLVEQSRILLPLYSDGFDFSLIAISENSGATWKCSAPLIGPGAIQPSLLRRRDGTLVAYCRNNGPEPKKILVSESRDDGYSWSVACPIDLPNYGSSIEGIVLADNRWLLCYNDTGERRDSLVVALSENEGLTWGTPHLIEKAPEEHLGSFHYPSVIQTQDGDVHITYTCTKGGPDVPVDEQGRRLWETIKYVRLPLGRI